jgi:preprotein translocase subunit SecD
VRKSALWASLVTFVVLVAGLLALNAGLGNEPILGLDLKGGVSVILAPAEEGATSDDLVIIRDLVRDQLESSGIAEPDVRVEGTNVVVDLPGVNDSQDALQKVQVSGIVTLNPVLGCNTGVPPDVTLVERELPLLAGGTCFVGPSGATGEVFNRKSAKVEIDQQTGQWVVVVGLSAAGEAQWNTLASQCYSGAATCPAQAGGRGQLAIVLDDVIQSAPSVNAPAFSGEVSISGAFSEDDARSLASVLNRGAFPFQMETRRIETVSATAGRDAVEAATIAGIVGLLAMVAFMVVYYRQLSLIVLLGMTTWGVSAYVLCTIVSHATSYALTLAGATGIVIAVGVTIDSYVVYFERLREDMRLGRSMRNAAPAAFKATWRTIFTADVVSLIGSLILFWLSVGSVKGFALYLGLTTICDLLVFYFVTRPAVLLASGWRWFDRSAATAVPAATAGAMS